MPTPITRRNPVTSDGPPTASRPIDDTRIREITELAPPSHLLREFPASERPAATTFDARQAIHRVLHGADDRLLVVVGPCSIHDYDAAIAYATRLAAIKDELAETLIVVMRVYFENRARRWMEGPHQRSAAGRLRINEGLRSRVAFCSRSTVDLPAEPNT